MRHAAYKARINTQKSLVIAELRTFITTKYRNYRSLTSEASKILNADERRGYLLGLDKVLKKLDAMES